jgi:hypothetical protein
MGWILTALGWLWAFSGVVRIIAAVVGALPGSSGVHLVTGSLTLGLAWLSIWGGGKLRAKALRAKALKLAE